MKRALILTLLAFGMAGCSEPRTPVTVECSVDDTLVFVAYNVTFVEASAGMIEANMADGTQLVRRMQDNETCRSVKP